MASKGVRALIHCSWRALEPRAAFPMLADGRRATVSHRDHFHSGRLAAAALITALSLSASSDSRKGKETSALQPVLCDESVAPSARSLGKLHGESERPSLMKRSRSTTFADPANVPSEAELKGVSVWHLNNEFKEGMRSAGFGEDAKVYDIVHKVIRAKGADKIDPSDQKLGTSYVDALEGKDHVGRATHMLSYCWSYSLLKDIVPALVHYCESADLDPKKTYIWMCCLCVNQRKVEEQRERGEAVEFSHFKRTFGGSAVAIGHILPLMTPWEDPTYLHRLWCIFEMWTAIHTDIKLDVLMPEDAKANLREAVLIPDKRRKFYEALKKVDVQMAEATEWKDRQNIFRVIDDGDGKDFKPFNMEVRRFLKKWFMNTLVDVCKEVLPDGKVAPSDKAELCTFTTTILFDDGGKDNYDRAVGLLTTAKNTLRHRVKEGKDPPKVGKMAIAKLEVSSGLLATKHGDQIELWNAEQYFESAEELYQEMDALESAPAAKLYEFMGAMHRKEGKKGWDKAEERFMKSYKIYEKTQTLATPDGARLIGNIGFLHFLRGDARAAMERYQEAKRIHKQRGTLDTPGGALVLASIAKAQVHLKDYESAWKSFEQAVKIREECLALKTPAASDLLLEFGKLKSRLGDSKGALELFELARQGREEMDALNCKDGIGLLRLIQAEKAKLAAKR